MSPETDFDVNRVAGFVLAAGEGRRLRPVSFACPKALVPFCGVPLLELAASRLSPLCGAGTVVNCWYHAEQVVAAVRDLRRRYGWGLRISQEPELLDTGGGLRHGLQLIGGAEHILVHNADVVLDADLTALLDRHIAAGNAATILMVPNRGPCTVDLAEDGRVCDFRRPKGQGGYTFSGVHVLRTDVLDFLPAEPVCSIITAYERALEAGLPVVGLPVDTDTYWSDLGTISSYIHAHADVVRSAIRHHQLLREAVDEQNRRRESLALGGVRCTGATGIGGGLVAPPGTGFHNAVVMNGTRIAAPAIYADAVLMGGDVAVPDTVTPTREPDTRIFGTLGVGRESCRLDALKLQGSGRLYRRIVCGDRTWVWCAYSRTRTENSTFASQARFLAGLGLWVPHVELHLADVGELVLQDLGDMDLQRIETDAEIEPILMDVASQIARLHVLGSAAAEGEQLPMQPGFDARMYDWERSYFREHLLGNVLRKADLWTADVEKEWCELRDRLLAQPLVPIHRDLQSANIMVCDGQGWLIDFQGMRLGAAAYDLASLLYDPYRSHDAALRQRVWKHYCAAVRELHGRAPSDELLPGAAVQRLLQALGAYGKLWLTDGLEWYRQFIVPGLEGLCAAADSARLPALADMACLTRDFAINEATPAGDRAGDGPPCRAAER